MRETWMHACVWWHANLHAVISNASGHASGPSEGIFSQLTRKADRE
jgi:hypothetical protein